MATNPRSEIIQPGDTVSLMAKFTGPEGEQVDLDAFPTITVIQPSGGVAVGPTSVGIMRIDRGQYSFNYNVGLYPTIGTWRDVWQGILGGYPLIGEFTFTVMTTQTPAINTDGKEHLGDDPGFNFSEMAIHNINNLMKSLRYRLKNSGKSRTTDEYGNPVYKDCDIFQPDELVGFLVQSLSMFNEYPRFTTFSMENTEIIEQFHDILVQGATYLALGSQALIERGREFPINDNGVSMTPPTISEMLQTQYAKEMDSWEKKCMMIKKNMVPSPLGLGTLSFTGGAAPQFRRLRLLRERQVI